MVFGWLFNIFILFYYYFFAKIKAKFSRFDTLIRSFFDSDVTEKHGNKLLEPIIISIRFSNGFLL